MTLRLLWSSIAIICLSGSAHAGFVEICKDSFPVGVLSGLFSFTIAGQSGTFDAPVGACTQAFQLPDGFATITEVPHPGAKFYGVATFPDTRLITFDSVTASATVLIVPGDISTQTVVFFTNTNTPEPASGWLLGSGVTLWALRRKFTKRLPTS